MAKAAYEYPKNRKSTRVDLVGQRFGRLVVISFKESVKGSPKWNCLCDCGNEVVCYGGNLKKGHSNSCGCYRKDRTVESRSTKNGASKHPLWGVYNQMVSRCHNEDNPSYYNYGGRGIKVCDRWLESAFNFYEDMGDCPEGMSLERVNNDQGYSPENCKWETKSMQQFNQRIAPNNTSGRTGVYWREDRQTWSVQIDHQNETIRLGCYKSFEKACEVRAEAELKYFGFNKE